MNLRMGIDVGGSTIDVVLTDGSAVRARITAPTEAADGQGLADELTRLAREALAEVGHRQPVSVGIGMPGIVDVHRGTVAHAVNLGIGREPFPLASVIADRLQVPTAIDNDVRAAALEVLRLERLREPGLQDLLFVNLGTGVSAAIVQDGQPRRGPVGTAGEIGHVPVPWHDEPCRCGRSGCLEASIAGPALARRSPFPDVEELLQAAQDGHQAAQAVATLLVEDLAFVVRWLSAATGIGRVRFGGGVGTSSPALMDALRQHLRRPTSSGAADGPMAGPSVEALSAGHPTGALGAAALAASGLPQHQPTARVPSFEGS